MKDTVYGLAKNQIRSIRFLMGKKCNAESIWKSTNETFGTDCTLLEIEEAMVNIAKTYAMAR